MNIYSFGNNKISSSQLYKLLVILVLSTADVFLPALVSIEAKQDSWISVIAAATIVFPVSIILVSLASRFPNKTLPQFTEKLLGKYPGKLVNFLYLFFFIHITAIIVSELTSMLNEVYLRQTPIFIITIIVILATGYTVRKGLETIGRVNEILFPVGIGMLVLVIILSLNNIDLTKFLPIFEFGPVPIIKGALPVLAWMGELVIILMLYPQVADQKRLMSFTFFSILVLLLLLELGTLAIAIFSPQEVANFRYPALEILRIINIGVFFQRFDSLFIAAWLGGIYLKIVVFFYATSLLCSQLFNLSDYKHIVPSIGSLLVILSLILFENTTQVSNFLREVFPFYAYIFEIIIPLLLLIISFTFKKKEG